MATVISDPSVRFSTAASTFSQAATAPRVVSRPLPSVTPAAPAIPTPPASQTGYGRPAQVSTFSSVAPPPYTAPIERTFSSADNGPALPEPVKAQFNPPPPAASPPKVYVEYPYVHDVSIYQDFSTSTNSVAGGNHAVQFNTGSTFAASADFTYNDSSKVLTVAGAVNAISVLTDHIYYANGSPWVFASAYNDANVAAYLPTYTGLMSGTLTTNAQPNITSVGTLNTLTVTGNIAVGGILTDHLYYANGMVRTSGAGGGGALSISPEVFRGTGAQTVFNLAVNPQGINNTQIFISGVYQQKATYACVGTELTFSQAPPSPELGQPDNIEVLIYSLV